MPERYVFRPRDLLRDWLMESVCHLFDIHFPEAYLRKAVNLIKAGAFPIIVSNHQSHADVIVHALIAERIIKETGGLLKGFRIPYAISVSTGHQGKNINFLFRFLKDWFEERGLLPFPVTRDKDKSEYGITDLSRHSVPALKNAGREGFGVSILPEGTVQAGRKDHYSIHRMRHGVEGGIELAKQTGNVLFLPVSIHGTYNVFNPDRRLPSLNATISTLVGLAGIHGRSLASVTVGDPILRNSFPKDKGFSTTKFLMGRIAQQLPLIAQGVHVPTPEALMTAYKLAFVPPRC